MKFLCLGNFKNSGIYFDKNQIIDGDQVDNIDLLLKEKLIEQIKEEAESVLSNETNVSEKIKCKTEAKKKK